MATKAPVIPFDAEIDASKIEYVKHQITVTDRGVTETTEQRIPKITESSSPIEILNFFDKFTSARNPMRWTTGPKLFTKFP